MKKIYKRKSLRRLAAVICAALTAGTLGFAPVLYAHPILDSKDAAVSIATNGNVMDITSTAQNNLIKWVDFSISGGKTVDFHDKNYLNYVTGSAVSDIQGILKGTGSIYLINPNGILIGDTAQVNVGSLYLSTKSLTAEQLADYTTATSALSAASIADGDVINLGTLNADSVTVEGKNITFKNAADVNNGSVANVKLTAKSGGEIHIGSDAGGASGYNTNGHAEIDYELVNDATDLQNMQDNLSGNYMLAGDIDAGSINEFTPVGKGHDNAFTGRFDGLNYKIANLQIKVDDNSNTYAGLFGVNKGIIENLEVAGATVTNSSYRKGIDNLGAVAGYNYKDAIIRNVRNTEDIGYTSGLGVGSFGGIVGQNDGTIERAYNSGKLTHKDDANSDEMYIGGIVGKNDGVIKYAFNTGSITIKEGRDIRYYLGGIAGYMGKNNSGSTIENAYNRGDIESRQAKNTLGGIAGYLDGGTIKHTYNGGALSILNQTNHLGGIVGFKKTSATVTVQDSYSTAKGRNLHHEDGTELTQENMMEQETYKDFDFSENGAWRIYEGKTMPLLTAFLTRADHSKGTAVYNGAETGDVGTNYVTSTHKDAVEQIGGINYIKDYTKVTPRALTVTFGSTTKVYDGNTAATAGAETLGGKVAGDDLALDRTNLAAAYGDKNVGTNKNVSYTGIALTGDKARNYKLTADTYNGTGEITRKALELVADAKTITEGEELPTFTGSVTGFVESEGLENESDLAFALDNPAAATVGSYKVTGTLNGVESGDYGQNYTFTNATANDTAFTIAAKYVPPTPTPTTPSGGNTGAVPRPRIQPRRPSRHRLHQAATPTAQRRTPAAIPPRQARTPQLRWRQRNL